MKKLKTILTETEKKFLREMKRSAKKTCDLTGISEIHFPLSRIIAMIEEIDRRTCEEINLFGLQPMQLTGHVPYVLCLPPIRNEN